MIATCSCGTQFETGPIGAPEIVNGQRVSALILNHFEPFSCFACGAEYVPSISVGQQIQIDLIQLPRKDQIVRPNLMVVPN